MQHSHDALISARSDPLPARNECVLTVEPLTTPCLNGFCIDDTNTYVCICTEGFTGVNCTEPGMTPFIHLHCAYH